MYDENDMIIGIDTEGLRRSGCNKIVETRGVGILPFEHDDQEYLNQMELAENYSNSQKILSHNIGFQSDGCRWYPCQH